MQPGGARLPCLGFPDEILEKETGGDTIDAQGWLLTLAGKAPALVFWTLALIFGIIMLRRGGGRAERFFIAGAGIKIMSNLLSIPTTFILLWLFREDYGISRINTFSTGTGVFFSIVNMVGILCLIYAFWLKFKPEKVVEISP